MKLVKEVKFCSREGLPPFPQGMTVGDFYDISAGGEIIFT